MHVIRSIPNFAPCGALSAFLLAWALAGCGRPSPAAGAGSLPPSAPPPGMARIPGGTFRMGTNEGYKYEGPVHEVTVDPFYLDAREVTNAQFAAFVEATGHRTEAERQKWSTVFDPAKKEWRPVNGAYWRHPSGPGSSIKGKDEFPVVQVGYHDAVAYAKWAGKRLPTEAEWEFAARGGAQDRTYSWGNELSPGGKYMANFWQGFFPRKDEAEDGFAGLAPGGSFPPNDYGLYDMAANTWEWVQDGFDPRYYERSAPVNPVAPFIGQGYVIRGGSFLCAANYCAGYRVAARNHNDADSAGTHQGFRCAQSVR